MKPISTSRLTGLAFRPLSRSAKLLLVLFTLTATVWRVLTLVRLDDSPLLATDATAAESALLFAKGLMGLGFVALGLLAWSRVRTAVSGLFATFSIAAGVYFGGPLPVASETFQEVIWFLYFLVGAILSTTCLLHFNLVYPARLSDRPSFHWELLAYLPLAVAGSVAVWIFMAPAESGLRPSLRELFFAIAGWQSRAYLTAALLLIPLRFFSASQKNRRRLGLDLSMLGLLAGTVPWLVARMIAALFPGVSNSWGWTFESVELLFIFVPMGLCSSLLQSADLELPPSQAET